MKTSMKKTVSEKTLERKFCREIEFLGGMAIKNNVLGFAGMPDRTAYMPGGKSYIAEIKTTGKQPKKRQPIVIEMLRQRGFKVFVIDSYETLDAAINEIAKDFINDL